MKSRMRFAHYGPLAVGLLGIIASVWLFSIPNSRASTLAAIVVVAPTFVALAIAVRQAATEQEELAARASDLADAVANEWERRRLGLLGNYAAPADVEFMQEKQGLLVRFWKPAGLREGRTTEVLQYFLRLTPERLVIVGAPGSGKTVLAVELLMALLADRADREQDKRRRVPVLLNLSSWDTRQPLKEWLTRHLVTTYQIRKTTAQRLIDGHWIIPILDGLDEMDTGDGGGSAAEAMRQLNAYAYYGSLAPMVVTCREQEYHMLAGPNHQGIVEAAIVHLKPLSADQVAAYLSRRYQESGCLQTQDEWRQVCQYVKRHPDSSLALALSTPWRLTLATMACDAAQIQPDNFLVYRNIEDIDGQLLLRFVPSAVTIVRPRSSQMDVMDRTAKTERWLGRLAAILDHAGPDIILQELWKARARKSTRWLHALVSVPGSAAVGLIGAEVANGSTGLAVALSCMTIGVAFGIWAAVDPDPLPSRISPRRLREWRYSVPIFAFGLASGGDAVRTSGWKVGLTIWLLTTLAGCIVLGLRRGAAGAARPGDPLRNDLLFGIALGLAGGAWACLPGGLTGGLLTTIGIKHTLGLWPSIVLALALGPIAGISIGSRAWLRYVITLTIEALPRRLPWRLNGFLDWGYRAGILRVSGLAYQFRHEKFRIWLSTQEKKSPMPDPQDPRGVRHTLVSLLLAAVAAVLAGPSRSLRSADGSLTRHRMSRPLDIRQDPLIRRHEPPGEVTIRRVLETAVSVSLGLDQARGRTNLAGLQ